MAAIQMFECDNCKVIVRSTTEDQYKICPLKWFTISTYYRITDSKDSHKILCNKCGIQLLVTTGIHKVDYQD